MILRLRLGIRFHISHQDLMLQQSGSNLSCRLYVVWDQRTERIRHEVQQYVDLRKWGFQHLCPLTTLIEDLFTEYLSLTQYLFLINKIYNPTFKHIFSNLNTKISNCYKFIQLSNKLYNFVSYQNKKQSPQQQQPSSKYKIVQQMFDLQRARQLQKQSHVRGMLSKQFYSGEQNQLEKKRKQMKRILDEQVEERRRVKEKQKIQHQRKIRKQQEQLKKYYADITDRQRRSSDNSSSVNFKQNTLKSKGSQARLPDDHQSRVKQHYNKVLKNRVNSKVVLQQPDLGDMPLLPVMAASDGPYHYGDGPSSHATFKNSNDFDHQNAGNIPLLDLSDESNFLKAKKRSKAQVKRQKTQRQGSNPSKNQGIVMTSLKFQQSRQTVIGSLTSPNSIQPRNQRRKTISDEDNNSIVNIMNSRVSRTSKDQQHYINRSPGPTKRQQEIPQEIEKMENQNMMLKSQLKKSQQAISLLIGAVRSNAKLDRFRVQAEKILHADNDSKVYKKMDQKKGQSPLLLPKLKVKHQSIMHDYLIEAARMAKVKQLKIHSPKY